MTAHAKRKESKVTALAKRKEGKRESSAPPRKRGGANVIGGFGFDPYRLPIIFANEELPRGAREFFISLKIMRRSD